MLSFVKIKENRDFKRLYYRGKSSVSPYFVLYNMKGRLGVTRLGITVGKAIGGAVKRNRAKRIITAAFREVCPNISKGNDFVIVARSRILKAKSTDIARVLEAQLKAVGLWYEKTD